MMATSVAFSESGGIVRICFQSETAIPLLEGQTRSELADAVDRLAEMEGCRVVVFESEGRVFLAGADIREMSALTPPEAEAFAREGQQLFERIARLDAVTVAAIHGTCAGGGFELALACDLRIAARESRLGLPEVTLGLLPGFGGTVRMRRMFGPALARRVILTGELMEAAEAGRLGLVHAVHPLEQFREQVDELCQRVLRTSPRAKAAVKGFLDAFEPADLEAEFEAESRAFGECFATGDAFEGLAAFLEKRDADWG
jgi:enoyl-CoA hydratase